MYDSLPSYFHSNLLAPIHHSLQPPITVILSFSISNYRSASPTSSPQNETAAGTAAAKEPVATEAAVTGPTEGTAAEAASAKVTAVAAKVTAAAVTAAAAKVTAVAAAVAAKVTASASISVIGTAAAEATDRRASHDTFYRLLFK